MQQITSTLPTEQLPLYTDYLHSQSQENKRIQDPLQVTSYQLNISDTSNSFFKQDFSWEYFSNELEFE